MKKNAKVIILYLVLIAGIITLMYFLLNKVPAEEIQYSQIAGYFDRQEVKSFKVDGKDVLKLTLKPEKDGGQDRTVEYHLRDFEVFWSDFSDTIREQRRSGVIESYDVLQVKEIPWWLTFLPYLLLVGVIAALWFFAMRQASGGAGKVGTFGRAKTKVNTSDKKKVLFKDVAGADEEKEELQEIVEYLKDPTRYTKLGAKIPHGVLLVGPPGTGKTLLAKAVAGEAGVPFYSISGSDFVELYVGVGASRVRDLFDTAKKSPASIIFIDEIDAVGRHRGAGLGGGHDEREQTLNQLLVEMDGFDSNEGIIVMAATNRPDILDPALLRPGRFDREITVNYPDLRGREEILKVHARGKPFEADVDLAKIAQNTVGFTGADLANLLNEAALLAARKDKTLIGMDEIEQATLKVTVGLPKKSMKIKEAEKKKTAYHEAGHAIVAYYMPTQDPVRLISIIPSGRALGYTLTPPVEDKYSVYRNSLKEEISMLLGGRAAESIAFDDISGGASNDIQRATSIARNMVTRYGMSDELGPIVYGTEHNEDEVFLGRDFNSTRNYSEETASKIDAEIRRIVEDAYEVAKGILNEHADRLDFVADFLLQNETMDEEQFKAAMEGTPTVEELVQLADERRRRSNEENAKRAKELEDERIAREAEEARADEKEHLERKRSNIEDVLRAKTPEEHAKDLRRFGNHPDDRDTDGNIGDETDDGDDDRSDSDDGRKE